ncbi:hypothetical protein ACEZDB_34025 [Streptacidiphilus sp. N1-3]|uniref:Apea-like HEPN domain-containing protein n=1 Tax=Streptacidiphilus alkalitolerans TaxID=3342712 RepID=A0ABV6XBN3_9ACTN
MHAEISSASFLSLYPADAAIILSELSRVSTGAKPTNPALEQIAAILEAAHKKIAPTYLPEALLQYSLLSGDTDDWNEEGWDFAESVAESVACRYLASGISHEAAAKNLTQGLHRRVDGLTFQDIIQHPLERKSAEYTVIVPLSCNKPLEQSQRFGVSYIHELKDGIDESESREEAKIRHRALRHYESHFPGVHPQTAILRETAQDPYEAGRKAITHLERMFDSYLAASTRVNIRILAPYAVLSGPNLSPVMEAYEQPSQDPAFPIKHDPDARLSPAIRFHGQGISASYPTVAIGLAWVSLESIVSPTEERPFTFLHEHLPAAVSPGFAIRLLTSTIKLAISEIRENPDLLEQCAELEAALPQNHAGYINTRDALTLMREFHTGSPGRFSSPAAALSESLVEMTPLTRRRVAQASAFVSDRTTFTRMCEHWERAIRALLTQMYIIRNSAFHRGSLEASREHQLKISARRITDLTIEVLSRRLSANAHTTGAQEILNTAKSRLEISRGNSNLDDWF